MKPKILKDFIFFRKKFLLLFMLLLIVARKGVCVEKTQEFWSPIGPYLLNTKTIPFKSFELGIISDYFKTTGYYDNDGMNTAFESDKSFSTSNINVHAGYGIGPEFDMNLGIRWRRNVSISGDDELEASGIESFFVSGKYGFEFYDEWRYATLIKFRQTSFSNTEYNSETTNFLNELALGDEGYSFTLQGNLSYQHTVYHVVAGSLAYRIPPAELSHEILWEISSLWTLKKVAFEIGAKGIYSMGNDKYAEELESKKVVNRGTTWQYNGLNRELIEPFLGISYAWNNVRINAELSQIISGVSTDEGYRVIFGLIWNSRQSDSKRIRIQTFKEYNIEAIVVKVSPRGLFVKVDKGISREIEKGKTVDIYKVNEFGSNILVGRGIVYDAGYDWSIIKIMKKYKNMKIETGFIVRTR